MKQIKNQKTKQLREAIQMGNLIAKGQSTFEEQSEKYIKGGINRYQSQSPQRISKIQNKSKPEQIENKKKKKKHVQSSDDSSDSSSFSKSRSPSPSSSLQHQSQSNVPYLSDNENDSKNRNVDSTQNSRKYNHKKNSISQYQKHPKKVLKARQSLSSSSSCSSQSSEQTINTSKHSRHTSVSLKEPRQKQLPSYQSKLSNQSIQHQQGRKDSNSTSTNINNTSNNNKLQQAKIQQMIKNVQSETLDEKQKQDIVSKLQQKINMQKQQQRPSLNNGSANLKICNPIQVDQSDYSQNIQKNRDNPDSEINSNKSKSSNLNDIENFINNINSQERERKRSGVNQNSGDKVQLSQFAQQQQQLRNSKFLLEMQDQKNKNTLNQDKNQINQQKILENQSQHLLKLQQNQNIKLSSQNTIDISKQQQENLLKQQMEYQNQLAADQKNEVSLYSSQNDIDSQVIQNQKRLFEIKENEYKLNQEKFKQEIEYLKIEIIKYQDELIEAKKQVIKSQQNQNYLISDIQIADKEVKLQQLAQFSQNLETLLQSYDKLQNESINQIAKNENYQLENFVNLQLKYDLQLDKYCDQFLKGFLDIHKIINYQNLKIGNLFRCFLAIYSIKSDEDQSNTLYKQLIKKLSDIKQLIGEIVFDSTLGIGKCQNGLPILKNVSKNVKLLGSQTVTDLNLPESQQLITRTEQFNQYYQQIYQQKILQSQYKEKPNELEEIKKQIYSKQLAQNINQQKPTPEIKDSAKGLLNKQQHQNINNQTNTDKSGQIYQQMNINRQIDNFQQNKNKMQIEENSNNLFYGDENQQMRVLQQQLQENNQQLQNLDKSKENQQNQNNLQSKQQLQNQIMLEKVINQNKVMNSQEKLQFQQQQIKQYQNNQEEQQLQIQKIKALEQTFMQQQQQQQQQYSQLQLQLLQQEQQKLQNIQEKKSKQKQYREKAIKRIEAYISQTFDVPKSEYQDIVRKLESKVFGYTNDTNNIYLNYIKSITGHVKLKSLAVKHS
ncbi:hypothetical protein PPERSA_08047 [Pseudocohnilembus persalinus]|uniref:Uncharacterized protein n=1 Tax=Pseudocohnilembus persalinus TaxID=266149 RepID=A0A0V0R357_PSEPJ|nr:hypothetical protein PPERSA_08047 [Pseudocohnilembus persalinus]|eukprot:KRX08736.1 hypothetical protein PPERSA_08047 [Pseudocohnilembus persalinus]